MYLVLSLSLSLSLDLSIYLSRYVFVGYFFISFIRNVVCYSFLSLLYVFRYLFRCLSVYVCR